jgi:hypothetical protein
MPSNKHAHSSQATEDQHQYPEELNRQDYRVRVAAGQSVVIPNVLEGFPLPLANTNKPDYSKALNMPVGVSLGC